MRVQAVVPGLRRGLGQLLFPVGCPLCDGPLADPLRAPVCGGCRTRLLPLPHPACRRCGRFFAPGAAPGVCGACRRAPPPFLRAVAAASYEGTARRAVQELKYRRREALAPLLAEAAATAWLAATWTGEAARAEAPAAVIPVPSPFWRRVRRGFQPAASIAEGVAARLELPLAGNVLRRRHSPPQTLVPAGARRRNVSRVFRVRRLPPALNGRILLLVDDVLTTGSTARAAVRALRRAGAGPVAVLTFARAAGPGGGS